MANILGEPFEEFVQLQIAQRQKSLGKVTNRSLSDLQYYNSKVPWIKLASSVNIESGGKAEQDLIKLGFSPSFTTGDQLSKNFVLFGGASNQSGTPSVGIGSSFSSAYGWAGSEERGYVPMPGIESADVTYQNNGALAKVNIKIKCYSRKQLALIDYLYLRPGYTLLLEFGWSVYFDNSGNLQTTPTWATGPFNALFDGAKNQYDIYKLIKEEKIKWAGNYEALLGKITNFKWSLNSDGTYDCSVTLTTLGDVIESLKLNTAVTNPKNPTELSQEENAAESLKNFSDFNAVLYDLYKNSTLDGWTPYTLSIPFSSGGSVTTTSVTFPRAIWKIQKVLLEDDWINTVRNQAFIRFGVLCAIIQSKYLMYDNKNTPITGFDINFSDLDTDENYMLTLPGQIPGDPSTCIIAFTEPVNVPGLNYYNIISNPDTKQEVTPTWQDFNFNVVRNNEIDNFVGRLSNVLVNINFISKVLYELPKDSDNNISILDFIKEVLNGINSSLGGINNFSVEVSIDDGLIRIYDKAPQLMDELKPTKKYAIFNVFGVRNNEGCFMRNLNMQSELSSNFASMVSIGAQSNGNQTQTNATSFSEFNAGLIDRIIPEKLSSTQTSNDSTIPPTLDLNDSFKLVYHLKEWKPEYIETLRSTISEYNKLLLGYYYSDDQTTVPFFIPFNMTLEMDGLAGMVLYQKFLIYENVLPLSYGTGNLDFIITGLNHKITTKEWTTSINTLSSPISK